MDKEKLAYYGNKYRKHQIKLSFVLMIIIVIIGAGLIGVGIFLLCLEYELYRLITAIIMILLGLSDIPLGIRFYLSMKKRIAKISDIEAVKRYAKIYGIDQDNLK